MSRSGILREIRALDAERDHERIVFLSTCMEFPFDTARSLELALLRCFCVPRVAALVDRSGYRLHPAERYDDTDLALSALLESGHSSDRGAQALARLEAARVRLGVTNVDMIYLLSGFVFEPIRWNARFGWRPMCENEKLALFHFWREVGRRIGVPRIPARIAALEEFARDYECRHFRLSRAGARVGRTTIRLFASRAPRPFVPLARRGVYALLDPPCRIAFGLPARLPPDHGLVARALRLRGTLAGWLPVRRRPRLRTAMPRADHRAGATEPVGG